MCVCVCVCVCIQIIYIYVYTNHIYMYIHITYIYMYIQIIYIHIHKNHIYIYIYIYYNIANGFHNLLRQIKNLYFWELFFNIRFIVFVVSVAGFFLCRSSLIFFSLKTVVGFWGYIMSCIVSNQKPLLSTTVHPTITINITNLAQI